MSFVEIQNNAAKTVMKAFRLSDSAYYYQDRESGERLEIDAVEKPFDFVVEDPTTGAVLSRKGRRFLVVGSAVGEINDWRVGLGRNTIDQPTPNSGDYIIVVKNETEKKYQIDNREPFLTIGSNDALYEINTVLFDVEDV
jgi:hypothetical protein